MELAYTNEEQEFRQEVRAFLKDEAARRSGAQGEGKQDHDARRHDALASDSLREGLDRAGLAETIWRWRLVDHAAPYL